MARRYLLFPTVIGLALSALVGASSEAPQSQAPKVAIPKPGVDQIMTLEDRFVRVAYNNEGYVTLGYRLANGLRRPGMDVHRGWRDAARREQKLQAEAVGVSLSLPDDSKVPLPTRRRVQAGRPARDRAAVDGHPRLDQLLSAERAWHLPPWLLLGDVERHAGLRRGRAQPDARLPRPALLQDSRRTEATDSTS